MAAVAVAAAADVVGVAGGDSPVIWSIPEYSGGDRA
jgi:hypothetical protein